MIKDRPLVCGRLDQKHNPVVRCADTDRARYTATSSVIVFTARNWRLSRRAHDVAEVHFVVVKLFCVVQILVYVVQ